MSLPLPCSARTEKGRAAAILQSGTLRLKLAGPLQAALLAPAVAGVKPLTAQQGGTRPRGAAGEYAAAAPAPRDRNHAFFPRFGKYADQPQLFHFNRITETETIIRSTTFFMKNNIIIFPIKESRGF